MFKLLNNNSYHLLSAVFGLGTLLSVLYSISFNLPLKSYGLGKAAQRGKMNFRDHMLLNGIGICAHGGLSDFQGHLQSEQMEILDTFKPHHIHKED